MGRRDWCVPWLVRLARILRSSVTAVCFAGTLGVTLTVLHLVTPSVRDTWLAWSSTNLVNLGDHPVGAMIASAFLAQSYSTAWIALALVSLAVVGQVLGNVRTAILVAAAHVGATAVSEGILWYRIGRGLEPVAARHVIDVGPSYIVICALVAGIAYGTWPGRLVSVVGFALVAPQVFLGLPQWELSSVGHVCSVLIGLTLGLPLRLWRGTRGRRSEPAG
jgi:Rhomboid-like protein